MYRTRQVSDHQSAVNKHQQMLNVSRMINRAVEDSTVTVDHQDCSGTEHYSSFYSLLVYTILEILNKTSKTFL